MRRNVDLVVASDNKKPCLLSDMREGMVTSTSGLKLLLPVAHVCASLLQ